MTIDLGPQAAEVARVVAGVRDDQLGAPTPCAGTPVAGLLDHLVGLTEAFRRAGAKEGVGGAATASAEHLAPDWRSRVPAQLDALAAAWRDPAAWQGVVEVGGVQLPADVMGAVALDEVTVHGWDLAVATGQRYDVEPAAAEACLGYVTLMAQPGNEQVRDGQFGPPVPVPDDAPVFDRVLALAGRDPAWRPPPAG
jgi:uncharacterized protein (TIGR03086 family)